jgi:hypothetical protein
MEDPSDAFPQGAGGERPSGAAGRPPPIGPCRASGGPCVPRSRRSGRRSHSRGTLLHAFEPGGQDVSADTQFSIREADAGRAYTQLAPALPGPVSSTWATVSSSPPSGVGLVMRSAVVRRSWGGRGCRRRVLEACDSGCRSVGGGEPSQPSRSSRCWSARDGLVSWDGLSRPRATSRPAPGQRRLGRLGRLPLDVLT